MLNFILLIVFGQILMKMPLNQQLKTIILDKEDLVLDCLGMILIIINLLRLNKKVYV